MLRSRLNGKHGFERPFLVRCVGDWVRPHLA